MSDLQTVEAFDLNRYLGTWYEIARLPMKHQPEDSTDISALYSLQDNGKVRVQNGCLDADGQVEEVIGEALVSYYCFYYIFYNHLKFSTPKGIHNKKACS